MSRPADTDAALPGANEAHDHLDEGGLARSVGTDDPEDAAAVKLEAHVVEGPLPAVLYRHVTHRQRSRPQRIALEPTPQAPALGTVVDPTSSQGPAGTVGSSRVPGRRQLRRYPGFP